MQRHEGGLADAEGVEGEQQADHGAARLALEDAAGRKINRVGQRPGNNDGRQQQHQRGAEEEKKIDAARPDRLGVGLMGDERIGRKRQRLVEQEQREQVFRKSDTDRAAQRYGETDIVGGLPWLVVAPHIADGIDRGNDPEPRGNERKEHSQRLDLEGEREPRHHLDIQGLGAGAGKHGTEQAEHRQEERTGRRKGDGFAQIGSAMEDAESAARR